MNQIHKELLGEMKLETLEKMFKLKNATNRKNGRS